MTSHSYTTRVFEVDGYMDVIKVQPEKRKNIDPNRFVYFDTEDEAKTFIRQRAAQERVKAEKALAAAVRRDRKCQLKFPATGKIG